MAINQNSAPRRSWMRCGARRGRSNSLKWSRPRRRAAVSRLHRSFAAASAEPLPLAAALSRVLAADVIAPVDAPPVRPLQRRWFRAACRRHGGCQRRRAEAAYPERRGRRLRRRARDRSRAGTATAIATGGVIPRGADAVVMIEQTELIEDGPGDRRCAAPAASGQFVSYAGSDIARGETLVAQGHPDQLARDRHARGLRSCRGRTSCAGPRVAVLSTGDELVEPGQPLPPGGVYDSNGAIIAAAIIEAGGEAVPFGAFPDDEVALELAMRARSKPATWSSCRAARRRAPAICRIASCRSSASPGILVHGVALKPGKPLCLAAIGDKPLIVLPGFPTSAIFTFHAFVAPVIRARAGLSPEAARPCPRACRCAIASELGREEFVLVSLVAGNDGLIAFPTGKGSGAVTAFSQADGFLAIDALASALDADTEADVTLIGDAEGAPDLVIMGSHDIALDVVVGALAEQGFHGAHHRGRQSGRRQRRKPRRMRYRAGSSRRSGDRHLQQASARARTRARTRLAADAGFCLSPRR